MASFSKFISNNLGILSTIGAVLVVAALVILGSSYRDASNLNAGKLKDSLLNANVARYTDATPTFLHDLHAPLFVGNVDGNAATATALANTPSSCLPGAFADAIDSKANLTCSSDGSSLSGVDAASLNGKNGAFYQNGSNINSGTVGDQYLSSNIARYNDLKPTFVNSVTAPSFNGSLSGNATTATALAATPTGCASGSFAVLIAANGDLTCSSDGSSLTNLNASNLTGIINNSNLSPSVTLKGNTFNGPNQLVNLLPYRYDGYAVLPRLSGYFLTHLNASNISTGTLADNHLSKNVTLKGNRFNGRDELVELDWNGALPGLNGYNLTNLNASNIKYGTLNNSHLSGVALLASSNNFSGLNVFTDTSDTFAGNAATATALADTPTGCSKGAFAYDINAKGDLTCSHDGAGLYGLDASHIEHGTLDDRRLASDVAFTDKNETFTSVIAMTNTSDTYAGTLTGSLDGNSTTATTTKYLSNTTLLCNSGFVDAIDDQGNISCSNNGSALTGLTASSISGKLQDSSLPSDVATYDAASPTFTNDVTAAGFIGDGSQLTNLSADKLSGVVAVANGGTDATTAAGARTNLGLGSIATQDYDSISITGGTIDGTAIGSTTPSTVSATDVTASGVVNFSKAASFQAPVSTVAIASGDACYADQAGMIFFDGGHFYGCTGAVWDQLDN